MDIDFGRDAPPQRLIADGTHKHVVARQGKNGVHIQATSHTVSNKQLNREKKPYSNQSQQLPRVQMAVAQTRYLNL
jgi:hypothetical protein